MNFIGKITEYKKNINKKDPFIIKKRVIGIKIIEVKILLVNSRLIIFFQSFVL